MRVGVSSELVQRDVCYDGWLLVFTAASKVVVEIPSRPTQSSTRAKEGSTFAANWRSGVLRWSGVMAAESHWSLKFGIVDWCAAWTQQCCTHLGAEEPPQYWTKLELLSQYLNVDQGATLRKLFEVIRL